MFHYISDISAMGRSSIQRTSTECGVSVGDREAQIMRRPWPTRDFQTIKKIYSYLCLLYIEDVELHYFYLLNKKVIDLYTRLR